MLEKYLIDNNFDSDKDDFSVIKYRLKNKFVLNSNDFAKEVIYVILASGFNQKIAKQLFIKIVNYLDSSLNCDITKLLNIFKNKMKVNAILNIWQNRDKYCNLFYLQKTDIEKLNMLEKLPYIGKITKNHLARNLGINVVKYDLWIQRLGVALYGKNEVVDNSNLSSGIKKICDFMFDEISNETGYPAGYIDVVLWKSCQIGLFQF